VVTKPGLPVAVGEAAINPVPRRMIFQAVTEVLPPGQGVDITVYIPGGQELASRTFNPRLGIIGGLSILGTTGIVEPMSDQAWQESIRLELSMLAARGETGVILVPGNYGRAFVYDLLKLVAPPLVKMSNFVGYTLQAAVHFGFKELLLVGDLGKLIKVAAGIFHTHSQVADARMEIAAAYAAALGAGRSTVQSILELNTTGAVLDLLEKEGLKDDFCRLVVSMAGLKASLCAGQGVRTGVVLYASTRGLLAVDDAGRELMERFADA
jgi:cobalt-precorrin-5B (C1)-methyltransferase